MHRNSCMKNRHEIHGDTVRIYLKRKKLPDLYTTIDLEDLPKVAAFPGSWYPALMGKVQKSIYVRMNTSYADRRKGAPNGISMHRIIMDTPEGLFVDHINHDTLNNRRHNLRNVTKKENNQWKNFFIKRGAKGYCFCNTNKRWIVSVVMEKNKKARQFFCESEDEARTKANSLLEARKLLLLEQKNEREKLWAEGDRRVESRTLESPNRSGMVL